MSIKEVVILVALFAVGVYVGKSGILNAYLPGG